MKINFNLIFRATHRHMGKPCHLYHPQLRRLPQWSRTRKFLFLSTLAYHFFQQEDKNETESDTSISDCEVKE